MGRLLVTGANGYIGSSFINRYKNSYTFLSVSLQSQALSTIDFSDVDAILHLSALVHQTSALKEEYFRVNTEQTIALAREAKANGVRHFVFFSTVAVYGTHGEIGDVNYDSIDEVTQCAPRDAYGESKYLAEKKLLEMEDDKFMVSIIRPPLVYGEECPGNMRSLLRLVAKISILPFDYNENKRSIVYIGNLIYFTHLVISNKISGITIPQDDKALSIREMVEALAEGCDRRLILFRLPRTLFRYLAKQKNRTFLSIYGQLVFNSDLSNDRVKFVAPFNSFEALRLTGAAGRRKSSSL